jgi:5'-methylthioadenosine phosphorylase
MTIGFIGGSGIYEALPLHDTRTVEVDTPYGEPSTSLEIGEFGETGEEVVFLPRHGPDHQLSPTHLPYRANIHALKQQGVEYIIASNAVGSLQEELPPETLVIPDQIYDETQHRDLSFFGDGIVVHQSFADPYSPELAAHLAESAREATDSEVVEDGTYVCIEGPQYATQAESEFYHEQGWEVIGMTTIPEAKLAREAEIAYATIAGVTDYGVWRGKQDDRLGEVLKHAKNNEQAIKATVEHAIREFPEDMDPDAHSSLEGTINTPAEAIPEDVREDVEIFVGDYLDD